MEQTTTNHIVIPFIYRNSDLRVVMLDGNPWFFLKDISLSIGERKVHPKFAFKFPKELKTSIEYYPPYRATRYDITLLSEAGVHYYLTKFRNSCTDTFRAWFTSELLPALRRTGKHENPINPQHVADHIQDYLKTNRFVLWFDPLDGSPKTSLIKSDEVVISWSMVPDLIRQSAPCTPDYPQLLSRIIRAASGELERLAIATPTK